MSKRRKKLWRYTAGQRPHKVEVCERTAGGMLYERLWNPLSKEQPYRTLGHRDRERAMAFAEEESRKLRQARDAMVGEPTVSGVLMLYQINRTPDKVKTSQKEDRRRSEMWTRLLGTRRVIDLGEADWRSFARDRQAGAIDARGVHVPEKEREPVGPRAADADLVFLVAVFNWALGFKVEGRRLLSINPFGAPAPGVKRALARPRNRSLKRPIATHDRYDKVRAAAQRVYQRARKGEHGAVLREVGRAQFKHGEGPVKLWMKPSYLPELFDLVVQTGRRVTAVCRLQYDDVIWSETEIKALRWRPIKGEDESVVPVSTATRATLMRIMARRPGIGALPMFPKRSDPSRPISRFLARDWLERAELLASVKRLDGGMFHPYRRMWATIRKHLPTKDVMNAGGWKDERSLRDSYQHADWETMLVVVNEPKELRERKASSP